MFKPKLNKDVEKRFDKELMSANSLPCCKVCQCENGKKIWCSCHRKQLKQHLADELARERERIKERAEKVVKELGLPKDYLDFMSAVFFVRLPSETKVTKHDRKMAKELSKNKHE